MKRISLLLLATAPLLLGQMCGLPTPAPSSDSVSQSVAHGLTPGVYTGVEMCSSELGVHDYASGAQDTYKYSSEDDSFTIVVDQTGVPADMSAHDAAMGSAVSPSLGQITMSEVIGFPTAEGNGAIILPTGTAVFTFADQSTVELTCVGGQIVGQDGDTIAYVNDLRFQGGIGQSIEEYRVVAWEVKCTATLTRTGP